jgi:hypothetical protein
MSDNAQIITQIRFALEQLSERNAEHEWEHLCRHLARSRICSNILPATGPVQSGGDQGRDFETFRTFLDKSTLSARSFVGLASNKPIAFTCTIEKAKGITSKIRNDITTIMSSGTRPVTVYSFCTCDVVVAKRHKLQEWAKATHGIHMEIIDGAAVAEFLCDRELFWLAQRYLQLPSELLPSVPVGADEMGNYSTTLERWRLETRPAQTFADFSDIRSAARTALGPFAYDENGRPVNQHERPELPFWIDRLDEIANHASFHALRRRSLYEATVLRLRGLGSLVGQENRLRIYFSNVAELEDSADLEDFQVLLTYVNTANRLGQVQLTDVELHGWADAFEEHLRQRIQNAKKHERVNEHCALLDTYGNAHLALRAVWGKPDFNNAFLCWGKLVKLAVHAPLFPLERFADHLTDYARYIGKHPDYKSLTIKVDALLAKRFGHFKAAEKCLDRALAFMEAGDLPRAIGQLHQAKIDWFAEETFGKALLALNCLSNAYSEQDLHFAAKYYALAAAFLALNAKDLRLKRFVARSLNRAASCDYALGAWHGFFELADETAIIYPNFPHDFDADFNKNDGWLQHMTFHLIVASITTKILHPALETFAHDRSTQILAGMGLADELKDFAPEAEEKWATLGPQGLWKSMEEQLAGPPWSDAGIVRRAKWRAHGVTWDVEWNNDYETTLAAEEFLAALQIFLSDLAGHDLCLMRITLKISIRIASEDPSKIREEKRSKGFDAVFEPSNTEHIGIVTLPAYRLFRDGVLTPADLRVGALAVASTLLTTSSLLPHEQFTKILDERFKDGLPSKLQVGATYGRCYREFISQKIFDASQRNTHAQFCAPAQFVFRRPEKLPWFSGPGPGYNSEDAQQKVRNRYEGFLRPVALTLKNLNKELPFRLTVSQLRSAGWKDWHILSAVYHMTMNYRLEYTRRTQSREAYIAASKQLPHELEKPDAMPVPIEEFEERKLREHFQMFVIAFAETYRLQLHQQTPDFTAIEDFLAYRYNFWTDDVEHADPFAL